MDAKEITDTVLALPIGQKKRLCAKLIWDIDRLAHLADANDRYAQVVAVAEEVTKRTGAEVKLISYVGPVIGSHTGAGVIALCFVGKER